MADAISQSSNSNPTVQYRTPTGQTVETPLDQAPPQVQLMYQQLPQAQAQTSTAQSGASSAASGATVAGVEAQKAPAQINLGKDLANKMTLNSALAKYTPLGMSADDIFKQYLSASPWGMPNETPQELQQKGVTAAALGDIGTPGSFMDRYNTKNALSGIRDLRSKWQDVSTTAKLPFLGSSTDKAQGYEAGRTILGNHLASLIPGASGAQSTGQSLLDTLPNVGDASQLIPGASEQKFNSVEDQLLKTKGYSYKDLGLPAPAGQDQKKPSSGGDLLTSLLGMVANPAINAANKTTADNAGMPNAKGNPLQAVLNAGGATANLAKNTVGNPDILGEAATLATIPDGIGAIKAAPEVLAKVLGKGAVEEGGAALANAPGKLSQFLTPNKAKATIGAIRDNLISTADKTGATIKGEDVANSIRQWADKAKLSNLPDADAIEQAAVNATKHYAGQVFKPSDLKNIYDGIETGYTKAGVLKSSASSFIDTGIKKIIADQVENVAPGFQKTSELFSKVFNGEKSSAGKIIKNLPQGVVRTGLNVAGLVAVGKLLGL
jgi:hypothetical protein